MKAIYKFAVRVLAVVGAAKVSTTIYGMIMPTIREYRANTAEANSKKP